jgi:hypothetical protein
MMMSILLATPKSNEGGSLAAPIDVKPPMMLDEPFGTFLAKDPTRDCPTARWDHQGFSVIECLSDHSRKIGKSHRFGLVAETIDRMK